MSDPTPDPTPPTDPMARLEQALRDVGSDASPPPGWESRVRAAVAESAPRRSWWWFALPSFGGLAAAVAGWALLIRQAPVAARVFEMTLASAERPPSSDVVMGDDEFRQHDVVTVDATPGGAHRRILVYVGNVPQPDACTTPPPCKLNLRLRGAYTLLAISSDSALPEPAGNFDTDQRAALDVGAQTAVKQFDVQ